MLTLRTLVDEMGLELASGEEAADAPVRWVHITELPDPTPWLSGGELILTTGLQLTSAEAPARVRPPAGGPPPGRAGLRHRLRARRAARGAGGRGARRSGFPVFEVPYELPFIAHHREGVRAAGERAVRGAPARDRDPQAPRAAGARGARPGRAGARAGRGDRRRGAGARRPRRDRWPSAPSGARCPPRRVAALRDEVRARGARRRPTRGGRVRARPPRARPAARWCCRSPRAGSGAPQAWLVAVRDAGGLGDFERLILQQAATVVALELMRQRAMRDTERRLAGDVLAEALTGRAGRGASWSRGCGPFGVGAEAAVLVFAAADPAGRRGASWTATCATPGVGALVATREQLLCAVVDARRGRRPGRAGRASARAALAGARRRRARPPAGRRRWARCGAASTRRAARSRPRRSPTAPRPRWPPTATSAPSSCCSRCRTTRRCACTATACSGPLEDGGGEYGDELIRSLEAFIEQNGQWEKAARELFCHRHTLRYRIRRVEELTGRDLGARATGSSSGWRCGRGSWWREGRGAGRRRHHRAGDRARPGRVRGGRRELLLLDLDAERAQAVADAHGGDKATAARGGRARRAWPTRSTASTCWSTPPATA